MALPVDAERGTRRSDELGDAKHGYDQPAQDRAAVDKKARGRHHDRAPTIEQSPGVPDPVALRPVEEVPRDRVTGWLSELHGPLETFAAVAQLVAEEDPAQLVDEEAHSRGQAEDPDGQDAGRRLRDCR